MQPVDLTALKEVAAKLDQLGLSYTFTGGIVLGFLLDHPNVVNLRPTDDLDAILVVDGREALVNEIDVSRESMRDFIIFRITELMKNETFRDCLPGHLQPDRAGQMRLPLLVRRLQSIVELRR